jgi:hypothetical protein
MKVVPLSEAREGRGCEKSVFVSDVNKRTLPAAEPSEQDLAEAAHQPLNVRLQSDLDSASTERALPQDSSIIPVSHAQNSCGSIAHAHNSCSSEALAQNSCDSVAHAQNSCNPSTAHARDSCSSKARTPECHFSASSCSSSSSISGRGRQEPVPTRPASLSEVMSGKDTNLSPCPNWDPPPFLSLASVCVPARNQRGGHTRLRVRGWGAQFRKLEKKPSTLSTLWVWTKGVEKEGGGTTHHIKIDSCVTRCNHTKLWTPLRGEPVENCKLIVY